MCKKIPLSISINKEIIDVSAFIKDQNYKQYGGNLETWIKNGELIWINDHLLISLNRIVEYKRWLDSYKAACLGLHNRRNEDQIIKLKDSVNRKSNFENTFKRIEDLQRDYFLVDDLRAIYRGFFQQPFIYLDALEKYNKALSKHAIVYHRYNYIAKSLLKIKRPFDSYRQMMRGIFISIQRGSLNLDSNLSKELLLYAEEIVNSIKTWRADYSFDLARSPVFIWFMEFIIEVREYYNFQKGQATSLPLITEYLHHIEEYKKLYKIDAKTLEEERKQIKTFPKLNGQALPPRIKIMLSETELKKMVNLIDPIIAEIQPLTNAQQVLIFHCLFTSLELYKEIDKKPLSEIISSYTEMNNKNVYDQLRDPFHVKESINPRKKDLISIIKFFRKHSYKDCLKVAQKELVDNF